MSYAEVQRRDLPHPYSIWNFVMIPVGIIGVSLPLGSEDSGLIFL